MGEPRVRGRRGAVGHGDAFEWERFRQELIAEIGAWQGDDWSYYERWLAALEHVLLADGVLEQAEIEARMAEIEEHDHHDHEPTRPLITVDLATASPVVLVIDMQVAFVSPDGAFGNDAGELIERLNPFLDRCRELDVPVIFSSYLLRGDLKDAGLLTGNEAAAALRRHGAGRRCRPAHPARRHRHRRTPQPPERALPQRSRGAARRAPAPTR